MRLWMSGEIQNDIADAYRAARQSVQKTFNQEFEEKSFGPGLVELAYIAIIREIESDDYREIKRYSKKDKDVEFRLAIPHTACVQADPAQMLALVVDSVTRAVGMLGSLKIPDFDVAGFQSAYLAFVQAQRLPLGVDGGGDSGKSTAAPNLTPEVLP